MIRASSAHGEGGPCVACMLVEHILLSTNQFDQPKIMFPAKTLSGPCKQA